MTVSMATTGTAVAVGVSKTSFTLTENIKTMEENLNKTHNKIKLLIQMSTYISQVLQNKLKIIVNQQYNNKINLINMVILVTFQHLPF